MSLVSLSSVSSVHKGLIQDPYNFQNNYPQPLVLPVHSQVCLTNLTFGNSDRDFKFHISGSDQPNIAGGNNKILFAFDDVGYYGGGDQVDVAILTPGDYIGPALATEIARAMNKANRLKYYTFSCVHSVANPNANPPELDRFTISYTETAGLNPSVVSGGHWQASEAFDTGNVIQTAVPVFANIVHSGIKLQAPAAIPDPIVNDFGTCRSFSVQKGLNLYTQGEGGGHIAAVGHFFGTGTAADGAPIASDMLVGYSLPKVVGSSAYPDSPFGFAEDHPDAGPFLKAITQFQVLLQNDNGTNSLIISSRLPVAYGGFSDLTQSRVMRRVDLTGIITAKTDQLLIRIYTFVRARAFVVQLMRSTDGGETFALLANDTGGNNNDFFPGGATDNRPKIYTETMNGMATGALNHPPAFASVCYSTLGVPTGAGTGAADGRVAGSNIINAFTLASFNPVPQISFDALDADGNRQKVITDFNLGNDTGDAPTQVQMDLNGGQGTTAGNRYTIQFNNDNTNGYDGTISIATAPTTTNDSAVPTTEINGNAFKKVGSNSGSQVNKWLLYANNGAPQAGAASVGTIIMTTNRTTFTITSTGFTQGHPFVGTLVGNPPQIITEELFTIAAMTENADDSILYEDAQTFLSAYNFEMDGNGPDNVNTDNPLLRIGAAEQAASGAVGAGSILNTQFSMRLGTITQEIINRIGFNLPMLRLKNNETMEGSIGATIGFDTTFEAQNNTTRSFVSLTDTIKDISQTERTCHISIPELSNVKSLEGESSQRYKTIKVLPKDSFADDDASGLLTYDANYEDWIDINNGRETQINELTLQIRKPNGTLAEWITGTARATIKFRQDPEVKRAELAARMSEMMAMKQNPGAEILVDGSRFVGS